MHAIAGQSMLALTASDLIFYAFMAVFIFGPWLAKVLKNAGQQGGSSSSQQPTRISSSKQRSTQAGQPAWLRRGKLEGLARRRREMRQQPKASSSDPSNLTMAQQTQRQRDKRLYDLRAKKMGETASPSDQPVMDSKSHSVAELERQHQLQQRQARISAAQSQTRQKQQAAAAYKAAKTAQSRTPYPSTRYSDPKKHAQQHEVDSETHTTHRLVSDTPVPALQPARIESIDFRGIRMHGPAMLRQAVVFKEIIDPPLALRDPMTG